jgi:hypothetical protein
MKAEIKEQWIAALRSGEYRQGMAALKRDGRFCCLGVLCDLHAKETGGRWAGSMDGYEGEERYQGCWGDLPSGVAEWAELPASDPTINGGEDSLSRLNDTGHSFTELAEVIESQF